MHTKFKYLQIIENPKKMMLNPSWDIKNKENN